MRKYFIKEFIETGAMLTRCDDWDQAKRLFIKLQERGANAYMFFYNDKGEMQIKDMSITPVESPMYSTNVKCDMTDHFFGCASSPSERRYNKTGRL